MAEQIFIISQPFTDVPNPPTGIALACCPNRLPTLGLLKIRDNQAVFKILK